MKKIPQYTVITVVERDSDSSEFSYLFRKGCLLEEVERHMATKSSVARAYTIFPSYARNTWMKMMATFRYMMITSQK